MTKSGLLVGTNIDGNNLLESTTPRTTLFSPQRKPHHHIQSLFFCSLQLPSFQLIFFFHFLILWPILVLVINGNFFFLFCCQLQHYFLLMFFFSFSISLRTPTNYPEMTFESRHIKITPKTHWFFPLESAPVCERSIHGCIRSRSNQYGNGETTRKPAVGMERTDARDPFSALFPPLTLDEAEPPSLHSIQHCIPQH